MARSKGLGAGAVVGATVVGLLGLLAPGAAASNHQATAQLVRSTPLWQHNPPSPDPAGITYVAHQADLLVSDSEVNEIPALFQGVNLFPLDLDGSATLQPGTTTAFSFEPTGLSYRASDQLVFVSDDIAREIYLLAAGVDGLYGTNDDPAVGQFDTEAHGNLDPEGVAYNPDTGHVYVVDGFGSAVYDYDPGPDGQFATSDDPPVISFDVGSFGALDPEGITYYPAHQTLLVLDSTSATVYEVSIDGLTLLQTIDIGAANIIAAAGVAIAPASNGPGDHLYIVARGVDNGTDPDENDGMLYEFDAGLDTSANRPPSFNQDLPDRWDAEGVAISLSSAAGDADGDPLTYSAANLPPGLSINSNLGSIFGTIDFTAATGSPYATRITVQDGEGGSDVDTFTWTATNTNRPPVADPIADGSVDEGVLFTFQAAGSDPDGDGLSWALVSGPAGATVTAGGEVSWIPTEAQSPGVHTVTLRITDDGNPGLSDDESFDLTVAEVDSVSIGTVVSSARWEQMVPGGGTNSFFYGTQLDVAFVGDWDCDGYDSPGIYRNDGSVHLRNANTSGAADLGFTFGVPGDTPIVGDFNGDGCDTVGVWRNGHVFIANQLGVDGGVLLAEFDYWFGGPDDTPFTGDFDGDGVDELGVYRPSSGEVFLSFKLPPSGGVASTDRSFFFGRQGDQLVPADWNEDGVDTVGVYRSSDNIFYVRYTNTGGVADEVIVSPFPIGRPIAGRFG